MAKITVEGYIVVPMEQLAEIEQALQQHIELTRREPGCTVFRVTLNAQQPNRFDVYEEFADKEAFALHQVRSKSSYWGKVSKEVERYYEITELAKVKASM